MRKFLTNELGASFIGVLIAGAAVIGGGVYMMKTNQDQKTVSKRAVTKGVYSIIRRELAETLADGSYCARTAEWGMNNDVAGDFDIPAIKNSAGDVLYDTSTILYDHKISKMTFEFLDLQADTQMHYESTQLGVMLESTDPKMKGYTIKVAIPLYTMMVNKRISSCLSDDAGSVSNAYKNACEALGGNYETGKCAGLTGRTSDVYRHLEDYFCSSDPSTCDRSAQSGQLCVGDQYVGIERWDNFVVAGIDTNGNIRCQCLPIKNCPTDAEKSLYCEGTDLGTDGCFKDCGSGTKTDGACASCTDATWRPLASNVCAGKVFSQVSNCGRVQENQVGTMAEVYSPAASDVCNGEVFNQTSNCGNSRLNQTGTKDCSCPVTRPRSWSQTISGTTYNCSENISSNITLQNGESLVAETPAGATNSGNTEVMCSNGDLYAVRSICNPLPKTLNCNIHYRLSFDRNPGLASDGTWSVIRIGDKENCGSDGCKMKMGVACPGSDAEVRVKYSLLIEGGWSPDVYTPWSGVTSTVQWGPEVRRKTQDNDECSGGNGSRGCGIKITAETRGGGTCSVSYGWGIENIRRTAADGNPAWFYCTNNYGSPPCEEHGCNEGYGCGMMAKLTCTI